MHEIEQLLSGAFGFNAASTGPSIIHRSVHERMAVLQLSRVEEYHARLQRDPHEVQELIECIVVPETWFFRNPEAMAAMRDLVLREWMPAHPGQPLRVLSVPCSTGEEPYSIAITLAEAALSREQVVLDAMDISRHSLARAARGIYRPNSFRDEAMRAGLLHDQPATRENRPAESSSRLFRQYWQSVPEGYELTPVIRRWVRFAHGNLARPDFRPPTSCYDVIFCRNVLIYFESDVQARVLETLHGLLATDGYLFVGPAEALLAAEHGFYSAGYRMAFACRKMAGRTAAATRPARTPFRRTTDRRPSLATAHPMPTPVLPPHVPERRRTPAAIPVVDALDEVRELADAGQLAEAAAACETHLHTHRTSAAAWYLLGLIRDALGDSGPAIECYRKALFLDPHHAEASMHLGLVRHHAMHAGIPTVPDGRAQR